MGRTCLAFALPVAIADAGCTKTKTRPSWDGLTAVPPGFAWTSAQATHLDNGATVTGYYTCWTNPPGRTPCRLNLLASTWFAGTTPG